MALLPFPRTFLELDVSPRQIDDTTFLQRARFVELLHTQHRTTGECEASILLEVTMYTPAADGSPGQELTDAGFTRRPKRLYAKNDTLVDASTGAILATSEGLLAADWQAKIASFEQDTMLQGDFFQHLRDNGLPGTIRQMIIQHIQQADALGRFA